MASREYTAQEMRAQAISCEHNYDNSLATAAMLRYAACVVERCEEIKSNYCIARNRIDKVTSLHPDATYEMILSKIKEFDYILIGATNG